MAISGVIQGGMVKQVIGRYRHKIQIVKPILTADSAGGWNADKNTLVLNTWASVEALSASEKWAAHEFASVVTHRVIMRHPRSAVPGGITADMQVQFNGRQFQIEGVLNPDERLDVLILICAELDDSKNQPSGSAQESSL